MPNHPGPQEFSRIEPISSSTPKVQVIQAQEQERIAETKFSQALEKADPSQVERRAPPQYVEPSSTAPSLLDVAKNHVTQKVAPTPQSLTTQSSSLQQQLRQARTLVSSTSGQLPPEATNKLAAQIQHMDSSLMDAANQLSGVEAKSLDSLNKPPMERFLTFLTESDRRLSSMVGELQSLDISRQRLTPEKLLAVHVKLGFVQQQLEFFTTTLNKALESIKTTMNVQI